ncbi:MAG: hypothetical protein ACI8U3_001029 [Brevundimonas sp.]|jgi:hypothetical protein|uniref:DUF4175 family protein n=1 Tax=Brevundimonas sp. TaxID=1871086 RepID=UPI0039E30136
MMLHPVLRRQQGAVRLRLWLEALAISLPIVLAVGAVAWRFFGAPVAFGCALAVAGLLSFIAARRVQQYGDEWLAARLDAASPKFEDSGDLLFRDAADLTGFAILQRRRLEARLDEARRLDLRPDWSRRRILGAWLIGAVIILAALFWPDGRRTDPQPTDASPEATATAAPRITGARLRIVPPGYTGLPAREQAELDARVPAGSRVEWLLDVSPRPDGVWAEFSEGARLAFSRRRDRWTGTRVINRSTLYRIEADGMARQRLHRIDAVEDAPPVVSLVTPDSQLVLAAADQTTFAPVFEVSDDYGVSAAAELRITVTQGEGESITTQTRTMTVRGRGDGRSKRFSATLNLAREGLIEPGDLIVQLIARDNRRPQGQVTEGPSVILRRSSELGLADGLDGLLRPVMPAYFASQRQIIMDAEALIAQRGEIQPRQFLDRSNGLGVDQARLRLRYGQFLGEESEGGGLALPTNDAPALPTNDAPAPEPEPEVHGPNDGHDHSEEELASFGSAVDVLNQYGHAHDDGDAATLFDPGTRSTLGNALDAMWSSERALRQGRPEEALPFAYQALEFLQEAQRADRVFLPRTGSDLPPLDMSRRLTGDRDDIDARLPPAPVPNADPTLATAWRALGGEPGGGGADLEGLERWVRGNASRLGDPLGLIAAIDTLRAEPRCSDCRRALRGLLWEAMGAGPARVERREAPNRRGRRYLEQLQ